MANPAPSIPTLAGLAELMRGPEEGRRFGADGAENIVRVEAPKPDERSFAMVESRLPPGWVGPPKHYHLTFDECWFVLEGSIEYELGDTRKWMPAGSSVFAPRGTPHHVRGPGPAPARMLTVMSSRQLEMVEGFFRIERTPETIREYMARYDTYLVE